jgi:hypothetical protein
MDTRWLPKAGRAAAANTEVHSMNRRAKRLGVVAVPAIALGIGAIAIAAFSLGRTNDTAMRTAAMRSESTASPMNAQR